MLGRPSLELTSNLRLAPSLHVYPLLHPSPPLFLSMWLDLVENSRCQRKEMAHRWIKRENSSLLCFSFLPLLSGLVMVMTVWWVLHLYFSFL